MYAYELRDALRGCGIEFTLLAWHSERRAPKIGYKTPGDPNLHDTCIIGAVGGLIFSPKFMTFQSRCIMAWCSPDRRSVGNVRGFAAKAFVVRDNVIWADEEVDENLLAEIREMDPKDVLKEYPNERANQEMVDPRVSGDKNCKHTKDWPLIQIVHEVLAKPFMFDATSEQWNGVGHWPLMVTVGDKRQRSEWSNCKRAADWEEKKRENAQEGRKRSPSRGGKSQGYRGSSRARNSERPDARVGGERSSGSGWIERSSSRARGTGWSDRSSGSAWDNGGQYGTLSK